MKLGPPMSKIGTSIQFSRTADKDAWPRIPFSNGIAGGPDTEPAMSFMARFGYALVWGFAVGVLWMVSP